MGHECFTINQSKIQDEPAAVTDCDGRKKHQQTQNLITLFLV